MLDGIIACFDGLFFTLLILSLFGGLMSGMLGIGGATVMIPLMLAVPPLLGVGRLEPETVAGLSMLQVLASAVSGLVVHRSNRTVNARALFAIGLSMAGAAFIGAWATSRIPAQMRSTVVLGFFAALMVLSLALLLFFKPSEDSRHGADRKQSFAIWKALLIGVGVGVASGIAGAGGGFIIVPLITVVLGLNLRVAIGTSLGIVFLGALAGSIGKVVSGQVQWGLLVPVLLGSVPAARLGAKLSRRLPQLWLRRLLVGIVIFSAVYTCGKLIADRGQKEHNVAEVEDAVHHDGGEQGARPQESNGEEAAHGEERQHDAGLGVDEGEE